MKNTNELTTDEQKQLTKYEAIVENGLKQFEKVGMALHAIQQGKLYRMTATTFASYVEGRFNITRDRAYEFIEAYKVAAAKDLKDEKLNEAQAAALAKVPAEKRKKVLDNAKKVASKKGKRVTAKDIHNAANGNIVTVYGLKEFTKDLQGLVNKAKSEGIPLLVITDAVGAVHAELVRMVKSESKLKKAA